MAALGRLLCGSLAKPWRRFQRAKRGRGEPGTHPNSRATSPHLLSFGTKTHGADPRAKNSCAYGHPWDPCVCAEGRPVRGVLKHLRVMVIFHLFFSP